MFVYYSSCSLSSAVGRLLGRTENSESEDVLGNSSNPATPIPQFGRLDLAMHAFGIFSIA